jgi:hypothetical protein
LVTLKLQLHAWDLRVRGGPWALSSEIPMLLSSVALCLGWFFSQINQLQINKILAYLCRYLW